MFKNKENEDLTKDLRKSMDLVPKIHLFLKIHIPLTIGLHNMVTVMPTIRFNREDEDGKNYGPQINQINPWIYKIHEI